VEDHKGKEKRLARFEYILELVPDNEKVYDPGGIQGRCEGKKSIFVPTARRLLICRLGLLGVKKEIDDYSWSKFDHVKITEGWGSSSLQLKFRRKDRVLKIEGMAREDGRALYKRIRERISKIDARFRIASKICPDCGEIINFIAKRCPHCGHEFEIEAE
jgi:hypothetical protein